MRLDITLWAVVSCFAMVKTGDLQFVMFFGISCTTHKALWKNEHYGPIGAGTTMQRRIGTGWRFVDYYLTYSEAF